jgi:4,5:9,10-diseco-3-hydroxy-5,9,17-trioxoandrosta-1(10),2-diene-4-oate hydrolase
VAPDLPGHGRSDKPTDVRYDALSGARLIGNFLKSIDGAPSHVVGVSAGGLIVGLTASYYPDLVKKVVLVSSAGLGRELSWRLILPSIPWLGRYILPRSRRALRGVLRNLVYDDSLVTDAAVRDLFVERDMPGNYDALAKAFNTNIGPLGLRHWQAYRKRITSLPMPVMLVWGKQDNLLPVRHAYAAVDEMKDARLHVFDRCGHWPPYEHADEFNELLRTFLLDGKEESK